MLPTFHLHESADYFKKNYTLIFPLQKKTKNKIFTPSLHLPVSFIIILDRIFLLITYGVRRQDIVERSFMCL